VLVHEWIEAPMGAGTSEKSCLLLADFSESTGLDVLAQEAVGGVKMCV